MWFNIVIFVLVVLISVTVSQSQVSKTVTIDQGYVRGYKKSGSDVFEFLGIPYATAPNGTDRFKTPMPPPTWPDIFEATNGFIACPQPPEFAYGLDVKEDCLVANVLTPDTEETNLPVLVYIHGGAFAVGFGQELSPKPLVESKRIVAVTFNYRLGAHGFLCLGTEDAPGNAGLKDMVALLRWVKRNIGSFGGNADDVTVAGYSAGSTAVDILTLSPVTEGLFNKAIPESAASVGALSVQIDPIKTAQEYARKIMFDNIYDFEALQEYYKTVDLELLVSDISNWYNYDSNFGFVPCVERDLGQERILVDSPVNIIKRGEHRILPMLYGFSNMEGMFRMPEFDSWVIEMNKNFSDFIPHDLEFENSNHKDTVAQTVKEFYFGSNSVGLYTLFDYINYFSDVIFVFPMLRFVKLQVEAGNNNIYLYEYSFYEKYPYVEGVPSVLTNFPGANHCAQTGAVLESSRQPVPDESITEEYRQMRIKMRELWINFITTGNPVPEGSSFPAWPPTNANSSPYMILGDEIKLGGILNELRANLWHDIYDQYYRYPLPPITPENESGSGHELSASILLSFFAMLILSFIQI